MLINIEGKPHAVDSETGEILGEYVPVPPRTASEIKADNKYYKSTTLNPYVARNTDEIEEFIKSVLDGRKLITIDNTRHYHDINCGEMIREGTPNQFTMPSYKIMVKLVKALTVYNCIICTAEDLGKILGCEPKDIKRTLKSCKSLVRYNGNQGMQKGFVKVLINPAFGWKGEGGNAYASQQTALTEWYSSLKAVDSDIPTKEFKFTEEMDRWLFTFKNSLKGFRDNAYEDQADVYFGDD